MIDVFISYTHSHSDTGCAALLANRLGVEGLSVSWDGSLSAGQDYVLELDSKIDESRCAVVLWSPRSVKSRYVRGEAMKAWNRGVLVPVMIEKADLLVPFNIAHTIDVSSGQLAMEDNMGRVLRAVRTMLDPDSAKKGPAAMTELDDPQFQHAVRLFREQHYLAALEGFRAVARRYPDSSEARYFLVLCALAGRRPKLLRSERVAEIDVQLGEAVRNAKGDASHIRKLWAIVRYDCYTMNGLREPAPTAAELLALSKPLPSAQAKELTSTIAAPGNPVWEALLATELDVPSGGRMQAKENR